MKNFRRFQIFNFFDKLSVSPRPLSGFAAEYILLLIYSGQRWKKNLWVGATFFSVIQLYYIKIGCR